MKPVQQKATSPLTGVNWNKLYSKLVLEWPCAALDLYQSSFQKKIKISLYGDHA